MIAAQQVVDIVLAEAARLGKADETIVLVTDRVEASLRWAGNSMTTNGVSVSRTTTVISIVRRGDSGARRLGDVQRGRPGGHRRTGGGVAGGGAARRRRPATARRCSPGPGCRPTGTRRCRAPAPRCSAASPTSLSAGFRGADRLYGFARHIVETTFLATSTGLRRRYTQPTGSVEINAKRDGASAWAGVGTPDFVDVPTDSMLERAVDAAGLGAAHAWSCPPGATRRSCRRRRWPT